MDTVSINRESGCWWGFRRLLLFLERLEIWGWLVGERNWLLLSWRFTSKARRQGSTTLRFRCWLRFRRTGQSCCGFISRLSLWLIEASDSSFISSNAITICWPFWKWLSLNLWRWRGRESRIGIWRSTSRSGGCTRMNLRWGGKWDNDDVLCFKIDHYCLFSSWGGALFGLMSLIYTLLAGKLCWYCIICIICYFSLLCLM